MAKSAKNSRLRTLKDRSWRDATVMSAPLCFSGVRYVARTFAVGILNDFVSSADSTLAANASLLVSGEEVLSGTDLFAGASRTLSRCGVGILDPFCRLAGYRSWAIGWLEVAFAYCRI